MPAPTNVLDEARGWFTKRLAELDEERKRLERALAELGGKAKSRSPAAAGRSSARLTPLNVETSRPPPTSQTPRWHPCRPGGQPDREKPGHQRLGVAKKMKIKPNYLYRVLGDLEKEGRVKKKGRQYHPGG